jgi:tetratricopeptide (TPR) repeat protein
MSSSELQQLKSQARLLLEAGRAREAATVLSNALSIAPDDDDVLCLMTQTLIELEDWKEAWRYVNRAVAIAPESSWAHRLHSIVLRNRARNREAVEAAKEAVRLDPWLPENLHTLASAQVHIFDLKEARQTAERLVSLAPSWYLSHQIFSLVALKEEKYKEAEAHCRRELELEPTSYYGMNNLGVALLNQKKQREAIEVLNSAAKLDPTSSIARENISAAAAKYLPRVGVPFFVLYIILNSVRTFAVRGQFVPVIVVLGILVLLVLSIVLVKSYRYRKLPLEVRTYLATTNGKVSRSRILKQQLWLGAIIIAAVVFVCWLVYILVEWNVGGSPVEVTDFILPAVVLLALAGSIRGYKRSRASNA